MRDRLRLSGARPENPEITDSLDLNGDGIYCGGVAMVDTQQNLTALFEKAWCPLFGKLPNIPENPNDLAFRCKQTINSARNLLGVREDGLKNLKSNWPDPSEIDNYPASHIFAARFLYGAFFGVCDRAERMPHISDDPYTNEGLYQMEYGIPDYDYSAEEFNITLEYSNINNKYKELQELFDELKVKDRRVELPFAYAIGAIKNVWMALGKIMLHDGLNDDISSVNHKIMLAEALLSSVKEWIMEPAVDAGYKTIEAGRRGGLAKGKSEKIQNKHDEWLKLAAQMWKKSPHRSKRSIALSIAKKTGGNFNTIRKVIKK